MTSLHLVMVWVLTMLIASLAFAPASNADTDCDPGPNRTLVGCNFAGHLLGGENLSNSNLRDADLTDADLTGANLTGANLTGANLTRGLLSGATLSGATLSGATLTDATLGAVISGGVIGSPAALPPNWLLTGGYLLGFGANLTGANLAGVDLRSADLRAANLTNAILTNAILTNINLLQANLSGANLSGANLSGADVLETILTDANLTGANLSGANLSGANLSGANLLGADLSNVILADVNITDANFTGADLVGVTGLRVGGTDPTLPSGWLLKRGYLVGEGAVLIGADLTGEDLTGANLNDANLTNTNLSYVNLTNAILSTDFSSAIIYNTIIGTAASALMYSEEGARADGNLAVTAIHVGTTPAIPAAILGRNVIAVGVYAFDKNVTGIDITSIDLGSVRSIGFSAFLGSSISGALMIPAGVTAIADDVFYDTGIQSLRFAGPLTSIGSSAFYRTAITSATFPSSLTSIGSLAFAQRAIQEGTFTFQGTAPTIATDAFQARSGITGTITVRYPRGAAGWAALRALDPNPFGSDVTWVEYEPPSPPNPDRGGGSQPATNEPTASVPSSATSTGSVSAGQSVASEAGGLAPGNSIMLIGGKRVTVKGTQQPRGQGIELTAGPVSFQFRSQTPSGRGVPTSSDGSLVIARSGTLPITGDGLLPGSLITQTLNSDPIHLGTTTVGTGGTFSSDTSIPGSVPKGDHTLTLTGTTQDGDPFTLAIGVVVTSPAAALGASPIVTTTPARFTPGRQVNVEVTGVQARCKVTFTLGKDKARTTANARGIAVATLTTPPKTRRSVPLRTTVSGKGCEPVTVTRSLRR